MHTKHNASKKHDLILIFVLLLFSAFLGIYFHFLHQKPALRAEVTIDGKVVEVLDLSQNQEITIHGARNGTNHLIIENGEIWCSDASCPDRVCVHQGKQSMDGDIIVCLPNLMIVQILGKE